MIKKLYIPVTATMTLLISRCLWFGLTRQDFFHDFFGTIVICLIGFCSSLYYVFKER